MEFQREIVMKFKATGLLAPIFAAMILAVCLLGQTLFVRATVAHTADYIDGSSDSARIARLETLLESLRQELKIPAYSAAIDPAMAVDGHCRTSSPNKVWQCCRVS